MIRLERNSFSNGGISEEQLHLDPLLNILQASGVGSHIGPFFCGSPTCADDVMLLADSSVDLQTQLSIVSLYSQKERYIVNPTKTTISVYGTTRTSETSTSASWNLGPTEPGSLQQNTTLTLASSVKPGSCLQTSLFLIGLIWPVNCLSRILPHSHGLYSVSGYRASMTYRHFTRSSMALSHQRNGTTW